MSQHILRPIRFALGAARRIAAFVLPFDIGGGNGHRPGDAIPATAPPAAASEPTTRDVPGTGVPYDEWTKAQLYERARELDVPGRSTMSKGELIDALRERT